MSALALLNMYVSINSQNISGYGRQATLVLDRTALDATVWSADGWTVNTGGLKAGTLAIESVDDFADDLFDEIMWTAFSTATGVVPFAVRPVNTTIGAGNPEYQGSLLVTGHSVGGAINTLAMKSLTFPLSGVVTRDITP